jgi:regulator of sigma E protease
MSPTDIFHALQVIFGIGLVIFVHEWGHFIAARLCGVRVDVFSIGFGPILISRRRGDTLYQLALVPLGGFCRMAGEERREDGAPPKPYELPAKSVPQRFFIYIAGVVMNVVFVLITYPIIFYVGMPLDSARIGKVQPGSPAWHAGVKDGSQIVSVNGRDCINFNGANLSVLLGDTELTHLEVIDPDSGEQVGFDLVPTPSGIFGLPQIGMRIDIQRDDQGNPRLGIVPGSAADRAGILSDEHLVSIGGSTPGLDIISQRRERELLGGPIEVQVLGANGIRTVALEPDLDDAGSPLFGFLPASRLVVDVRKTELIERLGLRKDDILLSLNGIAQNWFFDLKRILHLQDSELNFRVLRAGEELELSLPALSLDERRELSDAIAMDFWMAGTTIVVTAQSASAAAGLLSGDRVVEIDGVAIETYADIKALTGQATTEDREAVFRVEREKSGEIETLTLAATSRASIPDFGLRWIQPAKYIYKSDGFGDAILTGFTQSMHRMEELWISLKALVTQRLPAKSMGGIVSISRVSFTVAEEGWPQLFFFLSFLSLNLAFLNILPIPVLDGGHLFFLIIEGIKGSPVSARVMGYSQTVGVVLILSLMVYVTYNDIANWLFPGS